MTSKNEEEDDDMSNTDLLSSNYDPTDVGDDDQEDLPCCWCCRPQFSVFCRFRIFYFIYYLSYQSGVLFVSKQLSSQLKNDDDDYDKYNDYILVFYHYLVLLVQPQFYLVYLLHI